ncbi:bifunctional isocitrate dehydrogenase kinase/phosphatase [Roseivirga sp.]|uniref:bifunctional isocitrate dehydrogenase kinase/phosphatase n=1 Tax=Roseivirga sp. TaxID=1964215 RepID=UPI003B52AFF5
MQKQHSEVIKEISSLIVDQCQSYYQSFCQLSDAASSHFCKRQWLAQREASTRRLDVINESVATSVESMIHWLEGDEQASEIWNQVKTKVKLKGAAVPAPIIESFLFSIEQDLSNLIEPTQDYSTLKTKFNKESKELRRIACTTDYHDLGLGALNIPEFSNDYRDLQFDVDQLSRRLEDLFSSCSLELCLYKNLFFRNQHAYMVGLIHSSHTITPFATAFVNDEQGIKADAFFFTEPEIIRIFEFTRSNFMVSTKDPEGLISFLLRVMPNKSADQLIINLGFQEWGKMLMKSNFDRYLESTSFQLEHAPGIKGMVMIVFTLADYPLVFKIVKNNIKPPKSATRELVLEKYDLVARQDRVGRLADAQLFKYWAFPKKLFSGDLLKELEECTGPYLSINEHEVVFRQLFTERKMHPLNLFIETAEYELVSEVVLDYGHAIKEMAMTNIFPGDLLLKNFGVTPDHRVVFYDYDEVTLLAECNFRKLPPPRNDEELWDNESWLVVNENDIFPEELEKFMIPKGPFRDFFRKNHGEIFQVEFWNYWKNFYSKGGLIDIPPYDTVQVDL